jgi:hypothetical protein
MGIFDAGSVSWPSGPAGSKQTNYKRRAYGTVTAVGNKQFTCAGSKVLSFFNGAAVDVKRGGRYAPGAHLTSITTKNHGGGDMSEASLWEIEFQYTVYDKETLDSCATSFMIPGAQVDVKFGWNTGNSVSISSAEIFDFSWNYNVDNGSWSCTGKALGSAAGTAGGVTIPTGAGASLKDAIGEKKGFSLFAELDVRAQIGLGVKRDKDGKLTGAGVPSADGSAKVKGDFGIINAFVEAGWFSDVSNYQTMVKMSRVITDINTAISKNSGGVKYAFKSGKYYNLPLLKSADPLLLCFPSTGAAYHPSVTENKNNFSALTGAMGEVRDLWLSTQFLKQIEDDLLNKQSDKNRKGEYSANTYLSKLFGEISNLSGGVIDLAITTNPDDKKTFEIINKKYDVKYSGSSTLSLRSPNSPVKSVSMSSNMDPDMMAIAFSGGSGKYPNSMASNVFGGCSPINTPNTNDTADKLKSKIQEMGDKYDASTSTDFKKILREYANSQLGGKKISIRYNIDLSVTVDGFNPKFGQSFSVDPMPSSVGTGTINFVVGEIEHKVDGAVFETTVVGYMMVQT